MSRFKINWVLNNELAISTAPLKESHFKKIKENNIKSILNLCSQEEAPINDEIKKIFNFRRYTLPDHKVNQNILITDIEKILLIIENLKEKGSLLVHCQAARERSPIVCMSWLVKEKGLSALNAFEYMKEVHPRTNPLAGQLSLLSNLI